MITSNFLFLCLGLAAGVALGIGGYMVWLKQQANAKMRLPTRWPLTARVLMTNEEYEVFKWLFVTFNDHLVMVKLPVLRFTLPVNKDENGGSARWQELLGGVYCTFTICTPNGNVVGCVDVPGRRGLNRSNRELKESLLSDCRIAYTLVRSIKLPDVSEIRAAFLGEMPIDDNVDAQDTRGGDSGFHADLDNFKEKRLAAKAAALTALNRRDRGGSGFAPLSAGFNPDGTGAFGAGETHLRDKYATPWEDSFIHSDDSRPAKLN